MIKISDRHFEILGVTRQATSKEIKKAFKELIKKCHPDLSPNEKNKLEATRKSQNLIEAYNLLKDYICPVIHQRTPTESNIKYEAKQASEINWKDILRTRVKSSNVYSIGYDFTTNSLIIEFKSNKAIYLYFDVPIDVYDKFMRAESKGRFMGYFYKFKYQRVY